MSDENKTVGEEKTGDVEWPVPEIGEVKLLHQANQESKRCIYCGKPMAEWAATERCPSRE